jgi:hypothetical protein
MHLQTKTCHLLYLQIQYLFLYFKFELFIIVGYNINKCICKLQLVLSLQIVFINCGQNFSIFFLSTTSFFSCFFQIKGAEKNNVHLLVNNY